MDAPKDVLTTEDLVARWGGTITKRTLETWQSEGKGPRFFRPSGGNKGKKLYRRVDVEAWERENRS
jgi:hypothetical protein